MSSLSVDDAPVWSVVCFFVDRRFRGQGVTLGLLKAAVAYARSQGAQGVEGYPVEPGPRLYTYMGSPSTFLKAGFRDVTPAGQFRRVMRHPGVDRQREKADTRAKRVEETARLTADNMRANQWRQ